MDVREGALNDQEETEKTLQGLEKTAPGLAQQLRSWQQSIVEHNAAGQGGISTFAQDRPVQLPIWPEPVR
jgi:hypothetical protein